MKKPQKEAKKLTIIILNYNTSGLLKKCLSSIPENKDYQVIVVDNASSDDSVAMVRNNFPGVEIVESKNNSGFSAGNNLARPKAEGRNVLFLNPDTEVKPGAIETALSDLDKDNTIGIATVKVDLPDGSLYYACHRGFPTPWNSFCHFSGLAKVFPKVKIFSGYSLSYLPLNTAHEIDACSGTFLMIRKEILERINWFDEDYYWYGEDLDMCFRVRELGFKVYFDPRGTIVHYWGAASGLKSSSKNVTTANSETKRMATRARFEVMKTFYLKHYENRYPKIVKWLVFSAVEIMKQIKLLSI